MQLRPAFRVHRDKFFARLAGNTFCRLLRSEVGPAYEWGTLASETTWQTAALRRWPRVLLSWPSKTQGQPRKESLQRRGMKY